MDSYDLYVELVDRLIDQSFTSRSDVAFHEENNFRMGLIREQLDVPSIRAAVDTSTEFVLQQLDSRGDGAVQRTSI